MRSLWRCTLVVATLLVVACADEGGEESEGFEEEEEAGAISEADASSGARPDAAQPGALRDAAEPDAEQALDGAVMVMDAGVDAAVVMDAGDDAGPMDAGGDAGKDGGASDGGSDAGKDGGADAGKLDSGSPDASVVPDASVPDASVPDASVPDASIPANTFSSVYQILSANCSNCHGNSGGLNMSNKQRAYDELTGGPLGPPLGAAEGAACGGSGRRRVIAGEPLNSLIIQKLSGSPPCGSEMPPGNDLSPAAIAEIAAWITAGALNN